jgi:hypothetical protein
LNVGDGGIVNQASMEFKGDLKILTSTGDLLYTGKPNKDSGLTNISFSWTDRNGKNISLYFSRGILVDYEES